MRRIAVVCLVSLALPAAASAHKTPFPTGNSGVNQYLEIVPSATGGQPSNSIHPKSGIGGGSGGGKGGSGSSGSGGSASGASGPSGSASGTSGPTGSSAALAPATTHALVARGQDGVRAAALALASAPAGLHGTPAARSTRSGASEVTTPTSGPAPNRSAASGVLDAFSGSAANGGLGPILPAALIVAMIGAAVAVIRRRTRLS